MRDNEHELEDDGENKSSSNVENINEEKSLKILQLEEKILELEDRYLRSNADFENMKRRFEKEKSQAISFSNEQFSRDLLSVIDALEMASKSGENTEISCEELAKKIKEGIDLTIDQFTKCFEKHGVKEIDTNCSFDPNIHDAIMQLDVPEHKKGDIVQVLQKGYMIKDRILRPAMVAIAK